MAAKQGGGGGGGAGGGGDNSMSLIWVAVLIFFSGIFVWYYAHEYIVTAVFKINLFQARFFNLFLSNSELEQMIYIMQTIDPAKVTWHQLNDLSREIGGYMRYPVILVLSILAYWLYFSNITLKFRKIHDMRTLGKQEQHNWPAIKPVIKLDLLNEDISKGNWAMALSPMEFARKHNLLRKDDMLLDNQTPGREYTAGIRKSDAKRVFTLQLGPYWEGVERCPPHVQALAAVFMARINRDRDAATKILDTLNETFVQGKPNYSVAYPILKKYKNTELVQEIMPRHAYMLTMMASLLQASRDDGVVPTADFLWLKPVDRRLWYMLNCIGRQTPYVEVAAPFAHWLAEKSMGRRSLVPMVEEAIRALEIAIREVRLSPKQLRELTP